MKRDWTSQFSQLAAQLFLGGIGLSLLTVVCFRLGLDIDATAFAYLTLIALLSLTGSLIGSAILSIIAVGCLSYFFAEPLFSFRVDHPDDIMAIAGFVTTSSIVCVLTAKMRREAERARTLQRDLIETIPGLVWSALPDGLRDFHSGRWLEFTGLSSDEATGDGWIAVLHREDRARVVDKWRTAVATGEPFEVEARERNASGEYRSMLVRAAPRRDARGRIVKWYGSSTDLEDRKRATDALRLSEAIMAQAQQLASVGSWAYKYNELSKDWDEPEHWSAELWRLTGFDSSEGYPPKQEIFSRIHPEDRQRVVEANKDVFQHGRPMNIQYRFFRGDGELRVLHSLGTLLREDRARFVGATQDVTERAQRIERLRRSELYLSEAQRLANMGSWTFDLSGYFDYWSEELFRIYGFDPLQGPPSLERYLSAVHPEDREFMSQLIQDMKTQGLGSDVTKRIVRPDGEVRYLRCVGVPNIDNSGVLRNIFGTAMDVTEQEHLTQELQRREAYLAEAQRLSHTGSFGWNVSTDEIVWSDQTFEIFEYDRKTKPTLELVLLRTHPEDRTRVRQFLEQVPGEGKDWDLEHRLLMPDGAVKFVHAVARASTGALGNREYVGAVTDVTAVKQALEALRESEERFRDYAETASDWLWETGPDHRFTRVTEHDEDRAPGLAPISPRFDRTSWDNATDVELEPEKWRSHLATLDAHQPFRDFVYHTRHSDGSPRYVKTSGKPVFDTNGNFIGYRGTGSDVTAAVRADQAEAALRKMQADLAHVTRVTTVGELTAAIAHEINQPLTVIVSSANACLRWLSGEPPNLAAAQRAVERIVRDGKRAGDVISRIRALVIKSPPRTDRLNINESIIEVVALIRTEAQRNRISLRTALANDLPPVQGDQIQLQQVILNLIMNGIEAMSEISEAPRELLVESAKDGPNSVVVSVRDSGKGLDAGALDSLFEAFHTTKPGGMGVGLAISRTIIEAHGGRLWATPNIPQGAAFHFRLPNEGGKTS